MVKVNNKFLNKTKNRTPRELKLEILFLGK